MQFKYHSLRNDTHLNITVIYCDTSSWYITVVSIVTGIENLGDLQAGRLIYYFTISKKRFLVFPLEKRAATGNDRFRQVPLK